ARGRPPPAVWVQSVRHREFFVLLATDGRHAFFEEEAGIRDVRKTPIVHAGYSIGHRGGVSTCALPRRRTRTCGPTSWASPCAGRRRTSSRSSPPSPSSPTAR